MFLFFLMENDTSAMSMAFAEDGATTDATPGTMRDVAMALAPLCKNCLRSSDDELRGAKPPTNSGREKNHAMREVPICMVSQQLGSGDKLPRRLHPRGNSSILGWFSDSESVFNDVFVIHRPHVWAGMVCVLHFPSSFMCFINLVRSNYMGIKYTLLFYCLLPLRDRVTRECPIASRTSKPPQAAGGLIKCPKSTEEIPIEKSLRVLYGT